MVYRSSTTYGIIFYNSDSVILITVLQEMERIALTKGEIFPGMKSSSAKAQLIEPKSIAKVTKESRTTENSIVVGELSPLAYQKYFFYLQGPLVSSSVKFSEKKSIIGDDDDD